MELIFSSDQIKNRSRGLTFDDVLLMPNHCEVSSRSIPQLRSKITKNYTADIPFISANMDTVTEKEMALAMSKVGAVGSLHRFMSIEEQVLQVKELVKHKEALKSLLIAASVGVKEEGMKRADALVDAGVEILTLDIAHGDSVMMIDVLSYIKKTHPHVDVIAGNIATISAVKRLAQAGADAVKVGIGPGSMCTTRVITGCGVPQLSAIALCAGEAKKHDVPVIADGGIKTSGDIVKAFAAGASSVMLGSMLSGTLETPGELQGGMKKYRGMASKDAQVSWRGNMQKGMAPEGESRLIPCKGSVGDVLLELIGGVRSGMTYLNAFNFSDIEKNALFMEMNSSGILESRPHGMD